MSIDKVCLTADMMLQARRRFASNGVADIKINELSDWTVIYFDDETQTLYTLGYTCFKIIVHAGGAEACILDQNTH